MAELGVPCKAPDCPLPAMGFWMDYATGTVTDYCPGHFCGFALEVMHAMEEAARAAEGSEPGTLEEAQELAEPPAKGGRRRPRVMAVDSPLRAVVEDEGEAGGETEDAG